MYDIRVKVDLFDWLEHRRWGFDHPDYRGVGCDHTLPAYFIFGYSDNLTAGEFMSAFWKGARQGMNTPWFRMGAATLIMLGTGGAGTPVSLQIMRGQ